MSIKPASATVSLIDPSRLDRDFLAPWIAHRGWQAQFFDTAIEFLGAPRTVAPACLLLDLHLPGLSELHTLLAKRYELSIIFATDSTDIPATVRAMKAGAIDVLTRPLHEDTVSSTIATALELSRQRMDHQLRLQHLRARHATLSPREQEIMALIVSGWLNKQVGQRLNIAEITVKVHRGRVMQKMAVDSFAQLVHAARQLNITFIAPCSENRAQPSRSVHRLSHFVATMFPSTPEQTLDLAQHFNFSHCHSDIR